MSLPTDPNSLRTELVRIIENFSRYLLVQKQWGNTDPAVSDASRELIRGWGPCSGEPSDFDFQGPETASVLIVDSFGNFFKDEAGRLLTRILSAMSLSADSVFICTPGDKTALADKIRSVSPRVIIALGEPAARAVTGRDPAVEDLRGRFHDFHGVPTMVTFHPERLLTEPELKRMVWDDMKQVMGLPGLSNDS